MLLTREVTTLFFELVFAITLVPVLLHVVKLHTKIAEAAERLADAREKTTDHS